ncbi:regulator of chromosome condensation family protein [Striga asiatica]|uniref:Regulator of chromosome condensation family protein n=1 Tax=Striga asiatica TaxID=4170 RepID=A0A5A7QWE5_STRAF|nr:regulator of chromosome condensation family protein [Striga asiatica]
MAEEGQIQSSSSSGSGVRAASGPIRRVLLISAGASHSVALLLSMMPMWKCTAAGNVVCSWGRGEDGQLGHGDAEDRFFPTQLSALNDQEIVSVTCGADHTTAYSESKLQVYSWGWGDFGRLGHGNSSDLFSPQPIKALQGLRIRQIACGDSHCLAVTMEGQVQSWGRNQNGQLGLGTTEDSLVPRKIEAFQGISVKMVAAGAEHTAAVTEDGQLYGWGWGRYGNLGLGDRDDRLVPGKVSTNEGDRMVLVACGWRHTISVSSSGSLYTYGWSKYGQLGHGDFEDHLIPHKLEALSESRISQVDGDIQWQLQVMENFMAGAGTSLDHCSPVQVKFPQDQNVVKISCGWRHTLAVTDRQNVFSWGRGTNGQLGHGESVDQNVPKIIEALSMDGSSGQHIEASKVDISSEKTWVSPTQRYAVVPNENMMPLLCRSPERHMVATEMTLMSLKAIHIIRPVGHVSSVTTPLQHPVHPLPTATRGTAGATKKRKNGQRPDLAVSPQNNPPFLSANKKSSSLHLPAVYNATIFGGCDCCYILEIQRMKVSGFIAVVGKDDRKCV